MVAAPFFPDSPPQPPTRLDRFIAMSKCQSFAQLRSFAWRDDWNRSPQVARLMYILRVVRPITGKASYLFIAWAQPTAAMTGICATTPNNVLPLSILF